MTDWQLIETAPLEEVFVLVWDGYETNIAERNGRGWEVKGTGDDISYPHLVAPTHWMPLPAPPLDSVR